MPDGHEFSPPLQRLHSYWPRRKRGHLLHHQKGAGMPGIAPRSHFTKTSQNGIRQSYQYNQRQTP
jgi:hypothetical protein